MIKNIVFAPHPDDEVIGCGGAVVHAVRRGESVDVVTLGARLSSPLEADLMEEDYAQEAQMAHGLLGVSRHTALQIEPRTMQLTRELTLTLVKELRISRPEIVYIPHAREIDAEHRTTSLAVTEALWMAQSPYFPELGESISAPELVLAYEVWTPLSRYQLVIDITETIEQKKAAMRCYGSQARHADWVAAIEGLARYRGVTSGAGEFAEVFEVVSLARLPH
jgi:LmbE family N-acetylglucosaminyl deacetylase